MTDKDESKSKKEKQSDSEQKSEPNPNLSLKSGESGASSPDQDSKHTAIESSPLSDPKDRFFDGEMRIGNSDGSEAKATERPGGMTGTSKHCLPIHETFQREAEENEHFDPHFYKNIIATRQHDQSRRSCETTVERSRRDSEVLDIKVLARVVDDHNDHIETVVVKQKAYIGSGVFSDVYKGHVLREGQRESDVKEVAIKKIWPDPSREDRQIGIHRRLNHPNIARLLFYFVCVHPRTRVASWTIVMDLMPSTVGREQSNYIDKGLLVPQIYVKLWMFQTMSALAYMEKSHISHRDIKPENLLVDYDKGTLMVADFGSAKMHIAGDTSNSYQVTRYYRAPELCMGYTKYDSTVDVWSAGCILAELLTNRIIFYGRNNSDQLKKIIRIIGTPSMKQLSACIPGHYISESVLRKQCPPVDMYALLYKYNKTISPECVAFVTGVLRYECHERLRGRKALEHAYFQSLSSPNARLPNGYPLPPLHFV